MKHIVLGVCGAIALTVAAFFASHGHPSLACLALALLLWTAPTPKALEPRP